MTTTQYVTATDAAIRQKRRVKQGLVASWIHEISARHATGSAAQEAAGSVAAVEPARRPEPEACALMRM